MSETVHVLHTNIYILLYIYVNILYIGGASPFQIINRCRKSNLTAYSHMHSYQINFKHNLHKYNLANGRYEEEV